MRSKNHLLALSLCLVLMMSLALPVGARATSVKELDYAYIVPSKPYLVVGEETSWEVKLSHDAEPFKFTYSLYMRDNPVEETMQGVTQTKAIKDTTFSYKVDKVGYYMLQVEVMDKDYRTQRLRSESYLAILPEEENDITSPVGKAKAIAAEAESLNLPSTYDKVLWVNDWLTSNADYDKSMTIHDAAGVLLGGSGVCESYALANQLILTELGIDSIYVTGYAGGELHAWNLVNIDGDWTFVDTTWNDPVDGEEGYDYFGLSARYLMRDHDWGYSNYLYPPADTDKYNYLLNNGAYAFESIDTLGEALAPAFEAKQEEITYFYTGDEKYFDTNYELDRWFKENKSKYYIDGYSYGGSKYAGVMKLTYGDYDGYITYDSEEGLAPALENALKDRPAKVGLLYQGSDRYYDINRPLKNWLSANSRKYDVKTYSYSYTPSAAEITLEYGDYEGYDRFATTEELNTLMEERLKAQAPQLKLLYVGADEWYRLPRDAQNFMDTHQDLYKGWSGNWTNFEAVLDITY